VKPEYCTEHHVCGKIILQRSKNYEHKKRITSMIAALAVLSGVTSAVAFAANGTEKETVDENSSIVVESADKETDEEDTPAEDEEDVSEEIPEAPAVETRMTELMVARSEPSEGTERMVFTDSPARLEMKVEEPPPSPLNALTQPSASIISPIS